MRTGYWTKRIVRYPSGNTADKLACRGIWQRSSLLEFVGESKKSVDELKGL